MHKLVKPSGVVVEVNDSSLEYALSLGWKKQSTEKPTQQRKGKQSGNRANSNK